MIVSRKEDCKMVGVGISNGVQVLRHDVRTRTRRRGAKERARRKKLKQRINHHPEAEGLSETAHEERSQEVVEDGSSSSKNMGQEGVRHPSDGMMSLREKMAEALLKCQIWKLKEIKHAWQRSFERKQPRWSDG